MPDWLRARALGASDRPALVAGGIRLTFADLDRRAGGVARQLAALDVGRGTRAAVALRDRASMVVLAHALARVGAVMIPLNVRLAAPEMAWQVADARATTLISDPALAPVAAAIARDRSGLAHAVMGGADVSLRLADVPEVDVTLRGRVDLSSLQGIVYTSATTGRPKGVLLTYGNHWWSAIGSALNLGVRPDDRWLALLPFYHVGGLAMVWRSVIYGIPLLAHDGFDPEAVDREIDAGGVTIVSVVSAMLERMLDARGPRPFPPSLRCVLLGGGPVRRALLERCLACGVPVAPTYGLTEAASQVATLPPEEVARKPGSAGRPLLPIEVAIERDDRPAAPEEVGEILVRGPSVMAGYADRPDDTARALRGGWLHTGDLGYLDAEGYLYIVDRRDDLIISGGENIYPAEVEAVVLAHPAVADCCVVGVPDPRWGQAVAAVVTVRPGSRADAQEITAFCAGRLARYKVPARVWVVDALPASGSGKAARREVRAWAAGMSERDRAGRA